MSSSKLLSKPERTKIFIDRMNESPPAEDAEGAYQLLCETLNKVEDEYTTIPYNPSGWEYDGRLYPPQLDSARNTEVEDVVRYRSKRHNTRIHSSGAIRIDEVNGQCLLNKPGKSGYTI
jgi:hypothetical protein